MRRSDVLIVNFEHISNFFSAVYIVDFEQLNASSACAQFVEG